MNKEEIAMIDDMLKHLESLNQSIGEERYKVKIGKEINGEVLTEHINAALIFKQAFMEVVSLYSKPAEEGE